MCRLRLQCIHLHYRDLMLNVLGWPGLGSVHARPFVYAARHDCIEPRRRRLSLHKACRSLHAPSSVPARPLVHEGRSALVCVDAHGI